MNDVRRLVDNLEVVYDDFIKLLSTSPDAEPRFSFESELRAAYYAILSARECLGRTFGAGGIRPSGGALRGFNRDTVGREHKRG